MSDGLEPEVRVNPDNSCGGGTYFTVHLVVLIRPREVEAGVALLVD